MLKYFNTTSLVVNVSTQHNQKKINFLIKWSIKNTFNNTHINTSLKNKNKLNIITLYTNNLIKPYVNYDINWSSGMLSRLLFKFDSLESQKYTSPESARKDWSLWKFVYTVWWVSVTYNIQKFTPWSIRIRRFFKSISNLPTYTIIGYSFNSFTTPKKKIKRWLKKKYTTHSWR